MAPGVVRSKDGSRGDEMKEERDFHVLETDECVASRRRSSRAFVCLQAYLFVPRVSARRAAWKVTAWAVRSAISVGEATRSDETTRARNVWFGGAAEEGKEEKRKNLLVNELLVRFAAVDGENAPWPRLST
jgi:hypothetical protein